MSTRRIDFYLSHPVQYVSPFLRKLATVVSIKVFYFSDISVRGGMDKGFGQNVKWDTPLLEAYKYVFLRNYAPSDAMNNKFWEAINPGVMPSITKNSAEVIVVSGWTYFSTWLTVFTARITGRKVWLRAESPLNQELKKSKAVLWVKKWVLGKLLFKYFVHKFLYIGTENRKFFLFYGVPEKKLLYTPYAVDNDFFSAAWQRYKDQLPSLKQQLNIPLKKKVIVFSGKFIEKKRPLDLLQAFKIANNGSYCLVMVGDGPLRNEMMTFIETEELNDVLLTGFVNQNDIPKYYSIADVFVMCSGSGETWGLSVNEAMNFEKPVIVSDTCGCSRDLVQRGINGFVFEEGNIGELSDCIRLLLENPAVRTDMGAASGKLIKQFSFETSVRNMAEAVNE